MATISDVATRAGVGVGTVSRVLNGGPVSPARREKVLAAIEQLGYRPSASARALARGRKGVVGVVVPFFTHPSAVERMRGVMEGLGGSPLELIVFNVGSPEHRDRHLERLRTLHQVDGVLVISLSPHDHEVEAFRRAGMPVVLLDAEHPLLPRVVTDDVRGGELATEHLLALGHRRIAFMGDDSDPRYGFVSSARRLEGHRRALRAAGLPAPREYRREGPHGRAIAHRLTRELLGLPDRPTAIFAASDTQALGVLEATTAAGLDVPGDLSVVGFDDLEVSAYVGLTTVRQALRDSGRRGAELLLAAVEGRAPAPLEEVLPLELVARRTAGPPPGG
jgi:LacI family transcriptional regulator